MARIIKFRAWNRLKEEMYDPMPIIDFKIAEINAVHLMQFTGLQDKNGKDIYEGDIFGTPEQLRCVVEQEKDGAYVLRFIHPLMKNKKISILDGKVVKSPIIGNIYETPNLIKHGN